MTATAVARMTVVVCLIAAAVTTILGCTSTAGLSPGDSFIVLFLVGPYCLLAFLAWRQRRRTVAWVLLAAAVGLAVWGIYVSGVDSYRYHTEAEYRLVQRMDAFVVALVQWVAVLVVGLGLLGVWWEGRRHLVHDPRRHTRPSRPRRT